MFFERQLDVMEKSILLEIRRLAFDLGSGTNW